MQCLFATSLARFRQLSSCVGYRSSVFLISGKHRRMISAATSFTVIAAFVCTQNPMHRLCNSVRPDSAFFAASCDVSGSLLRAIEATATGSASSNSVVCRISVKSVLIVFHHGVITEDRCLPRIPQRQAFRNAHNVAAFNVLYCRPNLLDWQLSDVDRHYYAGFLSPPCHQAGKFFGSVSCQFAPPGVVTSRSAAIFRSITMKCFVFFAAW